MKMEDKEIRFWDSVDKLPNNMEQYEWDEIRADYLERMRLARIMGIELQVARLKGIFKVLELKDYEAVRDNCSLPMDVLVFTKLKKNDDGEFFFHSKEWEVDLLPFSDIFKHEEEAISRNKYYETLESVNDDDKYDMWLENVYNVEAEVEEFDSDIKLLKDDGWIEVLDGYWVEEYIVKEGKVDYYKACSPLKVAVACVKGRIKDLETIKNQNPDDLIIKP